MRHFLAILCLTALLLAGCSEDNYYTTEVNQSPGVRVLSPEPGATILTNMHWVQLDSYSSCRWRYQVDTVYYARISVQFGGGARTAQVFWRPIGYQSWYTESGCPRLVAADTFDIAFLGDRESLTNWSSPDTIVGYLYAKGLTMDSTEWQSEVIPFRRIIRLDADLTVPVAPIIDTVTEYSQSSGIRVNWCLASPGVQYICVNYRDENTGLVEVDTTFYMDYNWLAISRYLPMTTYAFWLQAGNDLGISAASDTMRLTTHEPIPPNYLYGYVWHGLVELNWQYGIYWGDSLLIARRDTLSDWAAIKSLPGTMPNYYSNYWVDSTVVPQTLYYYRIGLKYSNATWWSLDSASVWVQ